MLTESRPGRRGLEEGISSIPFQIAVHDGEENLEEEVHGVYQHREQIEPRLARHFDW
jgi:hypothetical protein